ncbi:hypothetical protein QBC47DRAFT_445584, partial [Echria macrotheca]
KQPVPNTAITPASQPSIPIAHPHTANIANTVQPPKMPALAMCALASGLHKPAYNKNPNKRYIPSPISVPQNHKFTLPCRPRQTILNRMDRLRGTQTLTGTPRIRGVENILVVNNEPGTQFPLRGRLLIAINPDLEPLVPDSTAIDWGNEAYVFAAPTIPFGPEEPPDIVQIEMSAGTQPMRISVEDLHKVRQFGDMFPWEIAYFLSKVPFHRDLADQLYRSLRSRSIFSQMGYLMPTETCLMDRWGESLRETVAPVAATVDEPYHITMEHNENFMQLNYTLAPSYNRRSFRGLHFKWTASYLPDAEQVWWLMLGVVVETRRLRDEPATLLESSFGRELIREHFEPMLIELLIRCHSWVFVKHRPFSRVPLWFPMPNRDREMLPKSLELLEKLWEQAKAYKEGLLEEAKALREQLKNLELMKQLEGGESGNDQSENDQPEDDQPHAENDQSAKKPHAECSGSRGQPTKKKVSKGMALRKLRAGKR